MRDQTNEMVEEQGGRTSRNALAASTPMYGARIMKLALIRGERRAVAHLRHHRTKIVVRLAFAPSYGPRLVAHATVVVR